jgi:hypothetical protein
MTDIVLNQKDKYCNRDEGALVQIGKVQQTKSY